MQAPFRAIYFLRFFGRQGFVLGFGGWVVGIRSHCRVPRCEKAEVLRRARGFRRWVRIRQGDWGWRYRGSGPPPRPLPGDASLSARTWLDAPAHHCVADSRQTPPPMPGPDSWHVPPVDLPTPRPRPQETRAGTGEGQTWE